MTEESKELLEDIVKTYEESGDYLTVIKCKEIYERAKEILTKS